MRLFRLPITVLSIACLVSAATFASPNHEMRSSAAASFATDQLQLAGSAESDRINSKIVVTERRPRGAGMEIRYRVEFGNVPQGRKYRLYLLTGYMQKNNLPEVDVSKQFGLFRPDAKGRLTHGYGILLYRGEWVRMRLKSVDGSIEKAFTFTLFK